VAPVGLELCARVLLKKINKIKKENEKKSQTCDVAPCSLWHRSDVAAQALKGRTRQQIAPTI
jgi:hypothetical protein